MSFEGDEEILEDFLIEAGEILEDMSEQLVELENNPEDMDLLNSIFRGFHTVKGGAGFLNLKPLVDICHITENIFDILRKGDRVADAELMDNILKSLDLVNEMFDAVRAGEDPEEASPEFLQFLGTFAVAKSDETQPAVEQSSDVTESQVSEIDTDAKADTDGSTDAGNEDITDEEFDSLLDELNGAKQTKSQPVTTKMPSDTSATTDSEAITDDEFEALLDDLHGSGQFKGADTDDKSEQAKPAAKASSASITNDNDKGDITDDEFESLLDELHGKGKKIDVNPPAATQTAAASTDSGNDAIDDTEFEALLDELHGSGKGPNNAATNNTESNNTATPKSTPAVKPKASADAKPIAVAKAPDKAVTPKKKAKSKGAIVTEATVRVDTKRLDDIMNMVGELVLARNRLKTLAANMDNNESISKAVSNLDIVTGDLQGAVMKTRMQPIKKVFGRFPRVVRDLARSLKKEIDLEMIGEETDLDKNLVEALADPLVHLVRNSVDHGIEMPDDRVNNGKPRSGTITLSAAQEGDHIMLIIEDDGKGMDADILRGIAVDKGLMDKVAADRLTDKECYSLIFHAGFSTKKEISDISGRGVGMDVVKTKITQLNGSLDIESELGKGTRILIKVPLTLAILPTLMVKIKDQSFAFPLTSVNEIFNLDLTRTNTVDGQLTIVVREKALPLFFLSEMLTNQCSSEGRVERGHVVLAQIGTQTIGFVVDSLVGQEEVVIKPLGKSLQGTPGIAGATITSDGKIALILDIPRMLKHYVG